MNAWVIAAIAIASSAFVGGIVGYVCWHLGWSAGVTVTIHEYQRALRGRTIDTRA